VSVTSFGDLVTEAERVLTHLVVLREPDALALAGAWPDFCRRAIHAVTAATGVRDPRWYAVDRLVVEAARPVRAAPVPQGGAPSPDSALQRAGVLLGAAGDVLASAPRDSVTDPMLADGNVKAAQARVAALLAAGAHTTVRALGRFPGDKALPREAARELAGTAMRVEQFATRVFQASPTTLGRADDVAVAVAVAVAHAGPLSLEEAVAVWAREARDTVRTSAPSARDLQGLAGDLSRVATHARAIVRAADAAGHLTDGHGQRVDQALAATAAGWLELAQRWTGLHTAQPPTPSKIAASHALGAALMAVTRQGRDWAHPAVVAQRVELPRALAAVRRAMDVAGDVADRQLGLPERLADSSLMFAPAALLTPSLERLHARLHGRLAPVPARDVTNLTNSMRAQIPPSRAAVRALSLKP
jgi:hypothetical protein